MNTEIPFLDRTFKNPVIAASGTYGYGKDYTRFYSPSVLGGIALKGLTVEPRAGNKGIRLWETPAGLLNSIGLENPGLKVFKKEILPDVLKLLRETQILVNVAGHSRDDFATILESLKDYPELLFELNLSCPNVSDGMVFGADPEAAYSLVSSLTSTFDLPLIIKLTPNCPSVTEVAKACQEAGAAGLSLINTIQGLAIDYKKKKPVFDNFYAGLSGPAIKPIALKMVYEVAHAVDIPVIGIGGIMNYKDVLEFLLAGATLVEVGTYGFNNPYNLRNIVEGLNNYCRDNNERLVDLIGSL